MNFVATVHLLTNCMLEFGRLEMTELVDMLSEQTAIYTKYLAERNRTPEYEQAKKVIKLIQAEILGRKNGNSDPIFEREQVLNGSEPSHSLLAANQ